MAHYIDAFPGREILLNHEKFLYFGGTAYLGLQTHTDFQDILIANIKKYGTNYGASRKSNVRFSVYKKTEQYLTGLVGSEACTTLSSGYLAGQFVCSYFNSKDNELFYAPNSHSALYQNKVKLYSTFNALDTALKKHLASKNSTTPVVFLDSIDFSGCNYQDFKELRSLPLNNIILVVDDSHGIGVVGAEGGGVYSMISAMEPKELIVCCSLGKGFAIQAGAVFGSQTRIKQLTDTAFFGGASPASPASMATLVEGTSIFGAKRTQLQHTIKLFQTNLKDLDRFSYMENHPAFSYADIQLTDYLKKNHVLVTDFSYPNEDELHRSIIILSASHTNKDIQRLTGLINGFYSS